MNAFTAVSLDELLDKVLLLFLLCGRHLLFELKGVDFLAELFFEHLLFLRIKELGLDLLLNFLFHLFFVHSDPQFHVLFLIEFKFSFENLDGLTLIHLSGLNQEVYVLILQVDMLNFVFI